MLLILVGTAVGIVCAVSVLGALDDRTFVPVAGEVVSIDHDREMLVVRSNSPSAPTHETTVRLTYRYTWAEQSFTAHRYAFDEPHQTFTDDAEAQAFVDANQPGTPVDVLLDPLDPNEAIVAVRELQKPAVFAGLSLATILWGIGALLRRWWTTRTP